MHNNAEGQKSARLQKNLKLLDIHCCKALGVIDFFTLQLTIYTSTIFYYVKTKPMNSIIE